VGLILANDAKAQAQMETERTGIKPEYAGANGEPGFHSFLLHPLDQHSSDSLSLQFRMEGDIHQQEFGYISVYADS
jgi:hypothetical protein